MSGERPGPRMSSQTLSAHSPRHPGGPRELVLPTKGMQVSLQGRLQPPVQALHQPAALWMVQRGEVQGDAEQ